MAKHLVSPWKRLGRQLNRILGSAVNGAEWVSTAALVLMALVVGVEIILRYTINKNIPAHDDFVRALMVFCIFLALAYTQRSGLHLRASFLLDRFSPRVSTALTLLSFLLGLLLIGLIATMAIPRAWESFRTGEYGGAIIAVPYWPAKFMLAVGVTLLAAQYLVDVVKTARKLVSMPAQNKPDQSQEVQ